ncbi:ferric reductase [Microtetraspora sp. NBRC 13810]|uniref:ferredoxin reductase family protein n=1 Tax=Microtetraspora sp. NBRC 13810 TaxID=3030990 RepID=UPI0024A40C71|nr:ferredoxin reductase family protein [Microtetraspora sp. NBRC 13810]GLW12571.1 ferric reductase [Microtetraspora sp. NBRC 13810]
MRTADRQHAVRVSGSAAAPTPHARRHAAAAAGRRRRDEPRRTPARAQANPRLVLAAVHAGAALATTGCWTGLGSLAGPADWFGWTGRLTGLLAGYACAVLLVLVARIPALDRGIGTDRLARWHAAGGRYTIVLTLVHLVCATAAHVAREGAGAVEGTIRLVVDGPGMPEAVAGTALLVGVAIVSVREARRRLSYEIWHYLHFATYAAVFLAFAHQLTGPDFEDSPLMRLLWRALYLSACAALLWHRFLTPVRRALRHRLRVAHIQLESPAVVSVYLTGEHLDELRAEPGQFFRWRFLAPGMWWTANPYSLSAPANPRFLRITVKGVGDHSRALGRLRPGTRVWAEGPYGALTAARQRGRKVLLIGGGVGISPLRTLFETLPGEVTLVYMARRDEDLVLRRELDHIAAVRGATIHYTVDDLYGSTNGRSVPLTGRHLRTLIPGLPGYDVYLCGPSGMTTAARHALRRAGVPSRRIHLECFDF